MVVRMEYAEGGINGKRRVEVDRMDDCLWRVWITDGTRIETVFRRSLTSAQSTARTFLQDGKFPR